MSRLLLIGSYENRTQHENGGPLRFRARNLRTKFLLSVKRRRTSAYAVFLTRNTQFFFCLRSGTQTLRSSYSVKLLRVCVCVVRQNSVPILAYFIHHSRMDFLRARGFCDRWYEFYVYRPVSRRCAYVRTGCILISMGRFEANDRRITPETLQSYTQNVTYILKNKYVLFSDISAEKHVGRAQRVKLATDRYAALSNVSENDVTKPKGPFTLMTLCQSRHSSID